MNDNNNILYSYKERIKYDVRKLKFQSNKMPNQKYFNRAYKTFSIFFKTILVISLYFCFLLLYKNIINKNDKSYQKFYSTKINNIFNYTMKYDEYNEIIDENYQYLQNNFCNKPNENINQEIENKIRIAKIHFEKINFNMFIYKIDDLVSYSIIVNHNYEGKYAKQFLNALHFYSKKNRLNSKEIYFIDVGANIGCHTFLIAKYGYKVISFEPNKINSYILYKNYCLNKDVHIRIINKGLDEEEKICRLKISPKNKGDGAIFCKNMEQTYDYFRGDVYNNIELTKLSKYMKFLSDKNAALMKIDVEGYEGKVIKGGKEIISKYHIPFIMFEFSQRLFKLHKTNILEFLRFFEKNGYKFSIVDFFSKKYISSEEIMRYNNPINLFVVYEEFIK